MFDVGRSMFDVPSSISNLLPSHTSSISHNENNHPIPWCHARYGLLHPALPRARSAPAAKLTLHAIFDSDMVLLRGKPITIWGWAAPGETVSP
jgi:hypothetical protein